MATVNTADYDLRGIDRAVKHDVKVLTRIWERVKDIKPGAKGSTSGATTI